MGAWLPVRQLTRHTNRRDGCHAGAGRPGTASAGNGHRFDARSDTALSIGASAEPVFGVTALGARPRRALMRAMAASSMGASGGLPTTIW